MFWEIYNSRTLADRNTAESSIFFVDYGTALLVFNVDFYGHWGNCWKILLVYRML
jgi:hypothetical protein